MSRLHAAAALLVRFLWQVVVAGASTAWLILNPRMRPEPGLVSMSFSNLNPLGAALLASLVTLTPGSTAVDIDHPRRKLLLHLLDRSDTERTVAGIRRQFERYLQVLFPERRS